MKNICISLIKYYRKYLSPMLGFSKCRFEPTCSEYMIQAIEKYGVFRGLFKGFLRILRCNPCCKGGYDPLK